MSCPITGEINCKCMYDRSNMAFPKVDLKSTMRKLFTDHAVYTSLVLKSIVDHNEVNTKILLPILLNNQKDIGSQIKLYTNINIGNQITKVLTEHIKFAGAVITDATNNSSKLEEDKAKLFKNSNEVAATLTSLNPYQLPYEDTQYMFELHNKFVINMTVARLNKNYKKEQKLYDAYYNEILMMSDLIADAL